MLFVGRFNSWEFSFIAKVSPFEMENMENSFWHEVPTVIIDFSACFDVRSRRSTVELFNGNFPENCSKV